MAKIPNILKLRIRWNKKENDFMVYFPRSCDGHFVNSAILSKRLITLFSPINEKEEFYYKKAYVEGGKTYYEWDIFKDLESRGYDLKTFKMEITIGKEFLATKFSHLWEELTDLEKESVIDMGFISPEEKK